MDTLKHVLLQQIKNLLLFFIGMLKLEQVRTEGMYTPTNYNLSQLKHKPIFSVYLYILFNDEFISFFFFPDRVST